MFSLIIYLNINFDKLSQLRLNIIVSVMCSLFHLGGKDVRCEMIRNGFIRSVKFFRFLSCIIYHMQLNNIKFYSLKKRTRVFNFLRIVLSVFFSLSPFLFIVRKKSLHTSNTHWGFYKFSNNVWGCINTTVE